MRAVTSRVDTTWVPPYMLGGGRALANRRGRWPSGRVETHPPMKQFTFSHYLVDEGNRDAFEISRRIADLEPVSQLPVVLLGEDGSGKTHLLYAIVNRLRAASARTGLAYVTAHDFPEQVRRLIHDPGDVQRAQSAVLLVDQLERIDSLDRNSDIIDELEAVIRIFLDNNHYVVVASSVHPERLRNLTDGLRECLAQAQVVPMHSQDPAKRAEIIEQRVRRELAEMIEGQRQEIAALKAAKAEVAETAAPGGAEREELQRRIDVAKAFGESLQRDLADAWQEISRLRNAANEEAAEELAAVVQEASTLRDERDALREELGRLHEVVGELEQAGIEKKEILREADAFRQQAQASRDEYELMRQEALKFEARAKQAETDLASAQAFAAEHGAEREELHHLRAELARLQAENEAKAALDRHVVELQEQLAHARAENDAARDEAGRLLQRAEGLLGMVETNRARFAEVEASQKRQIEELERLIAERAVEAVRAEELEAAKAQALAAFEQIEQQRAAYDERVARLEAKLAEAAAEADGVRDAHDRTRAERDQLAAEFEAERDRLRAEWEAERTALQDECGRTRDDLLGVLADRDAGNEERSVLRAEAERLAALLSAASSERDDLHAAVAAATGAESGLRSRVAELETELDALRHEAASQVAAVHAQAGEIEGRLARLQGAYNGLRQAADSIASGLLDFATEMRNGASELVDAAGRLSAHAETPLDDGGIPAAPQALGGPVTADERAGLLDVVQDVTDEADDGDSAHAFDGFAPDPAPSNGHEPEDLAAELHAAIDEVHVDGEAEYDASRAAG